MSEALTISAPAKINLTLEVLGRREDGFHQIVSVMQTISLADTLTLTKSEDIHFTCNHSDLVPAENLVVKAARLLSEALDQPLGAHIHLEKRIPIAAGLGGGSSDAAATLRGLNTLWSLNLPPSTLLDMASQLGADVPFFIRGGTALVEGKGDIVTPLPGLPIAWVVLLTSHHLLPMKTQQLYDLIEPEDFTSGEITRRLAETIRNGEELSLALLYNAFERVAPTLFPSLPKDHQRLKDAGARNTLLAGSGPTIFAHFSQQATAEQVYHRLKGEGKESYLAHTTHPTCGYGRMEQK
ncbi:MAG: 4-(cytidine 5'-diphospho)-2-C-methyl-D-erythritol kinase [Chloroflexi bacterium]|nr:4-(cytidine 5'-diphospho)-2-C-methyl-D-erythritol kinase [Chloroflexota bacterium]